jgi:23S rRNA (pseudouridine1915-N3)-methyltransferase
LSARFVLLTVGRGTAAWAAAPVAEWTKRLRRAGGLEEILIRPEPFRGDEDVVRAAEGERVLAKVGAKDRLVALDERGDRLDTPAFSALVDSARQTGRVVFAVGGPYGHSHAVRRAAWRTVRLSDLVLAHDVARVVLVEQLYRAITLLEGSPYHH